MSSPPDGTAFIVQDGSIYAINPHIYAKMAYNISDLTPTVMIAQAPLFLAVHQKVPVKTMKEFIDYVKANPGKLNYGSSGVGSTHHLSMEALKSALGLADDARAVQGHERIRSGAARRPRRRGVLGLSVAQRRGRHQEHHAARDQRRQALGDGAGRAGGRRIHSGLRTSRRSSASTRAPARRRRSCRRSPARWPRSSRSRRSSSSSRPPASSPPAAARRNTRTTLKREDERVAKTVKAAGMTPQ